MTPEEARDTLMTAVVAALTEQLPTLPVMYENADNLSLDTMGDQGLAVEIQFRVSKQASMEANPRTRHQGDISLMHIQREGTGTKSMLARVGTLNRELQYKSFGSIITGEASPRSKESHNGLFFMEWVVPFAFTE